MNPIFRLIDWLLREHGTFVSGLFVYVAVPFIAWHLGRRAERKKTKGNHTFILVIRPPTGLSEVPPVIGGNSSRPTTAAARLAGNAEMARAESGPLALPASTTNTRRAKSFTQSGLSQPSPAHIPPMRRTVPARV